MEVLPEVQTILFGGFFWSGEADEKKNVVGDNKTSYPLAFVLKNFSGLYDSF